MKRIEGLDRAIDLFGVGKDGFKAEVPGIGLGTEVTAAWLNAVQEAIVRTIEAAGEELSEANYDQFTDAVIALITSRIDALGRGAQGQSHVFRARV